MDQKHFSKNKPGFATSKFAPKDMDLKYFGLIFLSKTVEGQYKTKRSASMWKSTCFACLKTGSDWNSYLQKENGNFRTVALQALVKLPWELNLDEAEKQGKKRATDGFFWSVSGTSRVLRSRSET